MCGIGGIVYWDGSRPKPGEAEGLLAAQRHRGPDAQGIWNSGSAALTHNRLAIIDLSTGDQPMLSQDQNHVLVYNGELYNFQELRQELKGLGHNFSTQSDTEVVLQAYLQWGPACLEHLRGMFALAIFDQREQSLFLARDRIGIKPLFYYLSEDFAAFSSELQGLVSLPGVPRRMDLGALDLYLHFQYISPPYTIYSKVMKLPPASYLLLKPEERQPVPRSYWQVNFVPDHKLSEAQWLEALDHQVSESVRLHLVSDVPFGAFLSGGIDSSLVAYHMSRILKEPLRTFTIGFEENNYDERRYANQAAQHLGSQHHSKLIHYRGMDLLHELCPLLACHYGEPFADSSAIPTYFVSRLAREHVKMVLSGDGGDELFAGYNTYVNILGALDERPGFLGAVRKLLRSRTGYDRLLSNAQGKLLPEALDQHGECYAYFRNEHRIRLYKPEVAREVSRQDISKLYSHIFLNSQARECLGGLQHLDIKTYLCGDILVKVDIASMAHSLEVRVPLLDHKVVELAARVPANLKLFQQTKGELQQKYLLKKYVSTLYPSGFFDRPKRGFGVPIDHWFGGGLYQEVQYRLTEPKGILAELFARETMAALVATPEAARTHSAQIWALIMLEAWDQAFLHD